jgi:voltage-gated sodium channel
LKEDFSILHSIQLEGRAAYKEAATHCIAVDRILNSWLVEFVLSFCIILNLLVVVAETDATAEEGDTAPVWVVASNCAFLGVFSIELALRLMTHHFKFFKDPWNVMDFCVVLPDIVLQLLDILVGHRINISFFRVLRLLRLGRAVRILVWFPELFAMIRSLVFAMKAIFWGTQLIMIFLLLWSIIGVQFIHPLSRELQERGVWDDCGRCSEAFSSVPMALLTFFQQIVAGDSWGMVTRPIVEAYPSTFIYFLGVFVSVGMAIMNLILAVIVDKADDAKQVSLGLAADKKAAHADAAQPVLRQMCKDLDTDDSGYLSYNELVGGWDKVAEFREVCSHMDISREDMDIVWKLLDHDGSGYVDYEEFIKQMYKMKCDDQHMMLVFIRYYVYEIRHGLAHQIKSLKNGFDEVASVLRDMGPYLPGASSAKRKNSGIYTLDHQDGHIHIDTDARLEQAQETANLLSEEHLAGIDKTVEELHNAHIQLREKLASLTLCSPTLERGNESSGAAYRRDVDGRIAPLGMIEDGSKLIGQEVGAKTAALAGAALVPETISPGDIERLQVLL